MPDIETISSVSRAEELNAVGAKLFGQGQMEPARLHFLAALSLEPNNPRALQNLGAVLRNLGHYAAAESVAKRSVAASKDNPFCVSNLGVSQLGLRKYKEALATLKSVTVALPNAGMSWHNYGLILYMMGRHSEALDCFDKAVAMMPDNAQAASDRSLALLALGCIQKGLAAYEVRWKLIHQHKTWHLDIPEWQGEDLAERSILVHHEQGFGDSLMLVRFLDLLRNKGAHITLAVPESLIRLFSRSFPSIKVIDWDDDAALASENFDFHSPLLSVMRWLNITSLNEAKSAPYLSAEPMLALNLPLAQYKIGICWASGNHGPSLAERRRVVPLISFLPLTEISGVSVISLQKGEGEKDIVNRGLEGIIYDLSYKLEDFASTADVMSHLDLVISVDSAVAHLAGAIGKPCLMLSPYTRCWRWWSSDLGLPWYDKMYIYKQSQDGTWNEAMKKIIAFVRGKTSRHMR